MLDIGRPCSVYRGERSHDRRQTLRTYDYSVPDIKLPGEDWVHTGMQKDCKYMQQDFSFPDIFYSQAEIELARVSSIIPDISDPPFNLPKTKCPVVLQHGQHQEARELWGLHGRVSGPHFHAQQRSYRALQPLQASRCH